MGTRISAHTQLNHLPRNHEGFYNYCVDSNA